MKRLLWPIALCSLLLPLSSPAGETVTVEGVLVDVQCYVLNKSKLSGAMAADRRVLATCPAEPAKAGIPVAVWNGRVAGGELITVASPAYLLADHLAKPVRLTGELIAPRIVKPTKLEVKTLDGWVEVPTTAML